MGDRICRSSGAAIHWPAWFYKYVAATRLRAFALEFWGKADSEDPDMKRTWETSFQPCPP